MRAISFADLHCHNYKQFSRGTNRLDNTIKVIDETFELAKAQGIKIILFAGDLYDQDQALPTKVVTAVTAAIKRGFDNDPGVVLVAIDGNHDQAEKAVGSQVTPSALDYLAEVFPRFIRLNEVYPHYSFVSDGVPSCNVWGIKYHEYPEHFKAELERISKFAAETDGTNTLMIHQTPNLEGLNIPVDTNAEDPLYEPFDRVLCGHIHGKQQLSDKFYVLGSPLHRDLGDEGSEKGIWALNLAKPEKGMVFISRKGKYPEIKRIKYRPGEDPKPGDDYHFVVPEPIITPTISAEIADPERFAATLSPETLIKNYMAESMDEVAVREQLGFELSELEAVGLELVKQ